MATRTEDLDEFVWKSSYAFAATVTRLNASNEAAVAPGPGLIVARVERAFRASQSIGVDALRGREVTIRLADEEAPAVGERLLVFAQEWIYGTQIALRAVAHRKATAPAEKEVADAVERLPVRHLEVRLDGAVLVIDGEVESVGPSPIPDGMTLRSPNYQLAAVRVASALKGKGTERVNVLFPTNPAPLWRGAPRLKEHQSAVFLLRHEAVLKAPHEFYTALDPADVQPREVLQRIKSLLKQ